ncbi:MAG: exonuclease domain-containing protein [Rhodoluna sp.]
MNTESAKLELPAWLNVVAVFDTETTGLNLKESRIVTAALHLVDAAGNVLDGGKDWLINPGIPIPAEASRVHNVYDKDVVNAQESKDGVLEIVSAIQNYFSRGIPVVAYNAPYDFTILYYEALRHGLNPVEFGIVIDPLVIDKTIDKYRKGKRTLESVAERYKVSLENAHTAKDDAVAAGQVGFAMLRYFLAQDKPVVPFPSSLQQLHEMQTKWADEIEESYSAWRKQDRPDYVPSFGWPIKKL